MLSQLNGCPAITPGVATSRLDNWGRGDRVIVFGQEVSQLFLVVCLSILSGTGTYLHGCRAGRIQIRFFDLFTEMASAITAGLMAFYLAKHFDFDESINYLCVLLASNNSAEVLDKTRHAVADGIAGALGGFFNKGGRP